MRQMLKGETGVIEILYDKRKDYAEEETKQCLDILIYEYIVLWTQSVNLVGSIMPCLI